MLYGLLVTLFVVLCATLILLVLIQKGKSSMGLGNLGGGTQLLFGGSGGQDVMQKTTWILGAIFMGGSLVLAIMKRPATSALLGTLGTQQAPAQVKIPTKPAQAAQTTAPSQQQATSQPTSPASAFAPNGATSDKTAGTAATAQKETAQAKTAAQKPA